jgi:hypothetical protein
VLFVGPHQPYLAYVADVLPSLGEEGVQTCTLRDLLPEGATGAGRARPGGGPAQVDRRHGDGGRAGRPALRGTADRGDGGQDPRGETCGLSPHDWIEAFESLEPGVPHNEGRDQVWEELLTILVDKHETDPDDSDVSEDLVRRALAHDDELVDAFGRAWPLIDPTDLVGDLWSVPAYLRRCAPWLDPDEVRLLQRREPQAWTSADLPLLDAARQRLGDPEASRRRRRQRAAAAAEREEMSRVVDDLVASDDSDMQVMSMLRVHDLQNALVDDGSLRHHDPDLLAGPFAHIVVDEAQELTDAEWQMLLLRCPSRSFTVVGDRAQARHGFAESWQERLERIGLDRVDLATLTINYRTPEEVMAQAEPVIRAVLPDANVPTSVRSSGIPVVHGRGRTWTGSWTRGSPSTTRGSPASSATRPSGRPPGCGR